MTILPRDGIDGLGQRLMAVFLTLSILAFFAVLVRCAYRLKEKQFGADDVCSGISGLLFLILASMVTYSAVHGAYNPPGHVTLDQTELGIRTNTVGQAILTLSEAFGTVAIALLQIRILARIFGWKKIFLWIMIAITVIIAIFTSCVSLFQCKIPYAVWDLPLKPHTQCWSSQAVSTQATVASGWFTIVDFVLAFFPLVLFWDLQIDRKKKIVILVLLGLGVITGIASALKTSLLPTLAKNQNDSNAQFQLQVYSGVKLFLIIVLGCVPVLKRPWENLVRVASGGSLLSGSRRLFMRRSSTHVPSSRGRPSNQGDRDEFGDTVIMVPLSGQHSESFHGEAKGVTFSNSQV